MSRNTMSFALPEELRAYVDERVRGGDYGNTSEYLRELIRRDQDHHAVQRLRALVTDGLSSGDGRLLSASTVDELRRKALGPTR